MTQRLKIGIVEGPIAVCRLTVVDPRRRMTEDLFGKCLDLVQKQALYESRGFKVLVFRAG